MYAVVKIQAYVPDTVGFNVADFFFSGDNLFLGVIVTSLFVNVLSAWVI